MSTFVCDGADVWAEACRVAARSLTGPGACARAEGAAGGSSATGRGPSTRPHYIKFAATLHASGTKAAQVQARPRSL